MKSFTAEQQNKVGEIEQKVKMHKNQAHIFIGDTAKGVVSVTTPRGNVGQRQPMLHRSPRPILCRPGPPIH
jgi:hypothetical protein